MRDRWLCYHQSAQQAHISTVSRPPFWQAAEETRRALGVYTVRAFVDELSTDISSTSYRTIDDLAYGRRDGNAQYYQRIRATTFSTRIESGWCGVTLTCPVKGNETSARRMQIEALSGKYHVLPSIRVHSYIGLNQTRGGKHAHQKLNFDFILLRKFEWSIILDK